MQLQPTVYKSKKLPQSQIDAITSRIYNQSLSYIARKNKLLSNLQQTDDPQCTFQPNYAKKLQEKATKTRQKLFPNESIRKDNGGGVGGGVAMSTTRRQLKTENDLRRELVNIKVMKPYEQHLKMAEEAAFVREQDFIRRFPEYYPEKEQRLREEMEMFEETVKGRYW